ncbi:MAG: DNA polymerase IV [Actinobacteria bacterium]|nr:DNA polymerase IV [Cyanobacteriota bacterium]MCL5772265.1 DNA polymerase IV [Actinomycetota bacterium]
MNNSKKIIHVDMDAFFAQIEQRDNPQYKNKLLIVGGPLNRGVVSTASYEARRYGVYSGMPLYKAKKLCPDGIYVPVDMEKYLNESRKIREIFYKFTPLVEPVSCDEAFLDVTMCEKLFGNALEIAKKIKGAIYEKTNLTSSAGIGSNKFFAKLASNLGKPNGLTILENTPDMMEKIKLLPVSSIWGVGRVTEENLIKMGIKTIGDVANTPLEFLRLKFGEMGEFMHKMANGIDNREVIPYTEPKSIGREITLSEDTSEAGKIKSILLSLSQKISSNLVREGYKGKTVTLKVRYSDFKGESARITLNKYTDSIFEIYRTSFLLLKKFDLLRKKARMIGISVSNLKSSCLIKSTLFDQKDKEGNITKAITEINSKFGENKIYVAESVKEHNL